MRYFIFPNIMNFNLSKNVCLSALPLHVTSYYEPLGYRAPKYVRTGSVRGSIPPTSFLVAITGKLEKLTREQSISLMVCCTFQWCKYGGRLFKRFSHLLLSLSAPPIHGDVPDRVTIGVLASVLVCYSKKFNNHHVPR